jgi:hypothetical protein
MDSREAALFEMTLVFGIVLAIACWEWLRTRRALREDDKDRRSPEGD